MSLFDKLAQAAGSALGSTQGLDSAGHGSVMDVVQGLIQEHGGLGGLLAKFRDSGLGSQVDSWIGTGANHPISADQISSVLGQGQIGQIAQRLGIDPQQAANYLAALLPKAVDHLTPNGQLPAEGGVASALQMLKDRLINS